LHAIQHVNGATLWANLHLLFWLSLIPFTTAWVNRESLRVVARRCLWHRSAAGGDRLFHPYKDPDQPSWARLDSSNIYWTRQKRKNFNRDLRDGNPAGIRALMDCRRVLYRRRDHVADPRPSYREKSGSITRRERLIPRVSVHSQPGMTLCDNF
jgi:hypothetical protein